MISSTKSLKGTQAICMKSKMKKKNMMNTKNNYSLIMAKDKQQGWRSDLQRNLNNVTTTLLKISEPASLFILSHCKARIVLIMFVGFFFFILNFMRMARVPFRVRIDMMKFRTFI